jgi:ribonuclease VapC
VTDCLDSWAVLRWLEGVEPAASRVESALAGDAVMSWINVGEVFYVVARVAGDESAEVVVRELRSRVRLDHAAPERILAAARIKAGHAIALGDAFAVASAVAHSAVLLTGDPEILEADAGWLVEDLR